MGYLFVHAEGLYTRGQGEEGIVICEFTTVTFSIGLHGWRVEVAKDLCLPFPTRGRGLGQISSKHPSCSSNFAIVHLSNHAL